MTHYQRQVMELVERKGTVAPVVRKGLTVSRRVLETLEAKGLLKRVYNRYLGTAWEKV